MTILRAVGIRLAVVIALAEVAHMVGCGHAAEATRAEQRQLIAELRIGSEDRGPPYQFTEIRQVVGSDSEVFVLPAETPEIRVFDLDGQHRRTIGRRGAGPGEFEALSAFGLSGDTLWTIDTNLRRITRFSLSGDVRSSTRLTSIPANIGGADHVYFFAYPMAVMRDGSMLGFGGTTGRAIATGQVSATPLLHLHAGGEPTDTLGWVPIGNEHMILRSNRATMYRTQPFADAPLIAYAPLAERVFVVERYAATADATSHVRVVALKRGGDTAWVTSLSYQPLRLDPGAADSIRTHLRRALAPRFTEAEVDRALFVPQYRTPISDVIAGDDGSVWIGWETTARSTRFTVLAPDGRIVAEVNGPADLRLRWVGETVAWGQVVNEDDVPTLVRFQMATVR